MNTNFLSQVPNPINSLDQANRLAQSHGLGQSSRGAFGEANNLNQISDSSQSYSQLNNYNDLNSLQSLKYKSKTDKEGALDAAAQHFESIFVSMMIKGMRDANKVFSEGNMLQSSETEFYQQMFDSQLAVSLSTSKGIGLAEVIKRQLSKDISAELKVGDAGLPLNGERKMYDVNDYARQPFVSPIKVNEIQNTVNKIDKALEQLSIKPQAQRSEQAGTPSSAVPLEAIKETRIPDTSLSMNVGMSKERGMDFSSPDKFIESLYPYAKEVERHTGIDARLMLAQSALETGWGQHQILKEDGSPSFNLFGIKAQAGWQGDAAEITTTEYRQGVAMKERASFRAYDAYSDSFEDYAQFLKSNDRYQGAMQHMDNPKAFAEELQSSGYATDPKYADKISRIMDRYLTPDLSPSPMGETK